ncbi:MAG TPA: hypothetical protein PLP21_01085 [Pyrinomonadaceae bacterium]|nr:hypothetical protein [Acidobacteriota bacterium]HQZ94876.1 hypothetical protein [Pyrinomonadaceae bacterium]
MKKVSISIFFIAFLAWSASGQLIRLPRLGKPNNQPQPNQPQPNDAQPQSSNVSSPNSSRGAKRQDVLDDGFTWFEAVNGEALGGNNIPYSTGWYLKMNLKVLGEYPNRSAFKVVVSKGGKAIATTRCEAGRYSNTTGALDESYMNTVECWRKDTATKEIGVFDVQVFTVNGDTDAENLVRTYKIDVRTVNRVRSGREAGLAPPQYYINRHNEAPVSWLHMRPREYTGYLARDSRPERLGANQVEFYFSLSPSEVGKNLPHGYMRCSVNGKRLTMPGPEGFADQALSKREMFYTVTHKDRIAPKYQRGTEYQDEIGFHMVRLLAPLTWGERRSRWENRLALDDLPGNWECSLMNNGEVWRTWRFVVANGKPQMHPEQNGNINLGYNSYLLDMEIPASGSALDKRLNGASTGLFYGLPWTTPEGKAMAGRVPKVGNPFPVPSNSPNAVQQWWEK